ncbi:MAG: 2-polyprenyl-3-methyl-6-methoxy-1,4-benzoquinone monooxygenase [Gammaproteobacteria bacterium]|nr:2-polyprenyl-3-methyl-6-methoxy-1,4-benzoquinone monooxygenase [Gammaproteobacteria bacterium]
MSTRHYSAIDQLLGVLDIGLRTLCVTPGSSRPNPAADLPEAELSATQRDLSGRLMRINHAGEIAAQGLYQGQALTAKLPEVRASMQQAAAEENDHLNWCATRVRELGSHRSYLDPLWYLGSVTLGALAGLAGDKWSLGFVAETEKQVVTHLDKHLQQIGEADPKTRAILTQMKTDEGQHATVALEAGGVSLPAPVQRLMRLSSKLMTTTAYWV